MCLRAETARLARLEVSNAVLLQCFLRGVVTGIEPALSTWELLERMGTNLVPCGFLVRTGPECPLNTRCIAPNAPCLQTRC